MREMNRIGILIIGLALSACTLPGNKTNEQIIQRSLPVAIEFVSDQPEVVDSVLSANITNEEIYRWKNHLVVFDVTENQKTLIQLVSMVNPEVKIKMFKDPLYVFDKATHCEDASVADEWKHYLLTTNLVADTLMQREYMDYHATQFEEWPEVAQGFCKADFQQLLVYRNGRQLMLVISVPADKTLDELNPKTTENNPRVDDWNAQMAKYQEGIEGTEEGEVWVFLDTK